MEFAIDDFGDPHPNTYRLAMEDGSGEGRSLVAISTGGGMIEVQSIDGAPLSLVGDYHVTLFEFDPGEDRAAGRLAEELGDRADIDHVTTTSGPGSVLVAARSRAALGDAPEVPDLLRTTRLAPVLPVLSRRDLEVPFLNAGEMFVYAEAEGVGGPRRPRDRL